MTKQPRNLSPKQLQAVWSGRFQKSSPIQTTGVWHSNIGRKVAN